MLCNADDRELNGMTLSSFYLPGFPALLIFVGLNLTLPVSVCRQLSKSTLACSIIIGVGKTMGEPLLFKIHGGGKQWVLLTGFRAFPNVILIWVQIGLP